MPSLIIQLYYHLASLYFLVFFELHSCDPAASRLLWSAELMFLVLAYFQPQISSKGHNYSPHSPFQHYFSTFRNHIFQVNQGTSSLLLRGFSQEIKKPYRIGQSNLDEAGGWNIVRLIKSYLLTFKYNLAANEEES
jgi:hypothetical protein